MEAPRFLIQETYYTDLVELRDILRAAQEQGVAIRAIMQWPLRAGGKGNITEAKTSRFIYGPHRA
jgi:hypothetical protein